MERRFRIRLDELLADAEVDPRVLRGMVPRLERFLEPFVASLNTPEQRTHAQHYTAPPMKRRRRNFLFSE